jgi:hypothetical protein
MRRVIAAAVVSTLAFGGVTATQAFAAEHGANKINDTGKAQPAAHAKAKTVQAQTDKPETNKPGTKKPQADKPQTGAMKTVIYHGYEFEVPASWPVYRLDEHPWTCVEYDVNAVYLGTPGANQECPAAVIGRTQTVSVIPSTTIAAGSGSEITYQQDQPDGVDGTRVQSLPAVHAAVIENAAQQELRVALGAAALGATVVGTYGADPAVIEQVLATLRTAPIGAAATAQTGSSQLTTDAATATATDAATPSTSTHWHGVPPSWPVQIVRNPPPVPVPVPPPVPVPVPPPVPKPVPPPVPKPKPKPKDPKPGVHPVSGFDTCAAPALKTMRVWRRAYAAVGVYIGGMNSGCAYGNLSASWLRAAAGMGWGMMPTYVGLQAPCTKAKNVWTMVRGQAAAEGVEEGRWAVSDARELGLGLGSPIYFDMEGYGRNASCTATVLNFLGAWDREVTRLGYTTGVYSSRDSGIANMQRALVKTPGFTPPDAIWIALWDGVRTLNDGRLGWPLSDRIKQYAGIVDATVGGIELNIDKDVVGGPLAR